MSNGTSQVLQRKTEPRRKASTKTSSAGVKSLIPASPERGCASPRGLGARGELRLSRHTMTAALGEPRDSSAPDPAQSCESHKHQRGPVPNSRRESTCLGRTAVRHSPFRAGIPRQRHPGERCPSESPRQNPASRESRGSSLERKEQGGARMRAGRDYESAGVGEWMDAKMDGGMGRAPLPAALPQSRSSAAAPRSERGCGRGFIYSPSPARGRCRRWPGLRPLQLSRARPAGRRVRCQQGPR